MRSMHFRRVSGSTYLTTGDPVAKELLGIGDYESDSSEDVLMSLLTLSCSLAKCSLFMIIKCFYLI